MRDPRVAGAIVDLVNALARVYATETSATARVAAARGAAARPTTFAEFEEALPVRSQRFIELLRAHGTLRVQEVVDLLGLDSPKAVGGITGAIARWAPERGLQLPYESTRIRGQRAWRWLGAPAAPAPAQASMPLLGRAAPEEPAPQEPQAAAAEPAATRAPATPATEQNANLEGLLEALPDRSRRFVELLQERGVVDMATLLSDLGLNRAAAVQELLRPIREMAADFGFTNVFETTSNEVGGRVFHWPGTRSEPTNVAPLPVGGRARPRRAAVGAEGEVIPFEEPRAQQVAPGLMRRRRKSG